jgi:hypothetical protein
LLIGCAGGHIRARYSFNEDQDFSTLQTYAWAADTQENFEDPDSFEAVHEDVGALFRAFPELRVR